MIGYLQGTLLQKAEDRILVLCNQIGFEVLLPAVVMESMHARGIGDEIALYIYYHQTERQPKPVLIGFNHELEKDFFQHFLSVEAIGPLKAVKALDIPVEEVAAAIETRDVAKLKQLKGIGVRTAQKIVAALEGKMSKFALTHPAEAGDFSERDDFKRQVLEAMVSQLGHKPGDAKKRIADALKRNPDISTAEALLDEIYHSKYGSRLRVQGCDSWLLVYGSQRSGCGLKVSVFRCQVWRFLTPETYAGFKTNAANPASLSFITTSFDLLPGLGFPPAADLRFGVQGFEDSSEITIFRQDNSRTIKKP